MPNFQISKWNENWFGKIEKSRVKMFCFTKEGSRRLWFELLEIRYSTNFSQTFWGNFYFESVIKLFPSILLFSVKIVDLFSLRQYQTCQKVWKRLNLIFENGLIWCLFFVPGWTKICWEKVKPLWIAVYSSWLFCKLTIEDNLLKIRSSSVVLAILCSLPRVF